MKKKLRTAAVLLVICLMVACFSGCTSLDELKAQHAVWNDEDQNSILWQGEEYVYLYQETYEETPYSPIDGWNSPIYITDPDVPTLLADSYGLWGDVSIHGNYLSCNSRVFCKADQYDALKVYIDNGLPTDQYGYSYFDYNKGEMTVSIFSKEESRKFDTIIEETLANPKATNAEDWQYVCEIYYCCEDTELMKYTGMDLMESPNGYYLSYVVDIEPTEEELKERYGEDWEDVDLEIEEWITCPIPAEYNKTIEDWFEPVLNDGIDGIAEYEPTDTVTYEYIG